MGGCRTEAATFVAARRRSFGSLAQPALTWSCSPHLDATRASCHKAPVEPDGFARPALAVAPRGGCRAAHRGRLLRRREARSGAPVHRLGVGDLAARRASASPCCTCGASAGGPECCSARSSSTDSSCSTTARSPSGACWASRPATWRRSSWARCCSAGSSARTPRWIASSRSAACLSRSGSRPRQRDGGHALDGRRRGRRRVGRRRVLAHLVAGRHLRGIGRPPADPRLGSRSHRCLASHPTRGRAPPWLPASPR